MEWNIWVWAKSGLCTRVISVRPAKCSSSSWACQPVTITTGPTPAVRMVWMMWSIKVLLPMGRSGLKRPMREEKPCRKDQCASG